MSEIPLRKIHRFGPTGRFTRKQIRDAIDAVMRKREREALEARQERTHDTSASQEPNVPRG